MTRASTSDWITLQSHPIAIIALRLMCAPWIVWILENGWKTDKYPFYSTPSVAVCPTIHVNPDWMWRRKNNIAIDLYPQPQQQTTTPKENKNGLCARNHSRTLTMDDVDDDENQVKSVVQLNNNNNYYNKSSGRGLRRSQPEEQQQQFLCSVA